MGMGGGKRLIQCESLRCIMCVQIKLEVVLVIKRLEGGCTGLGSKGSLVVKTISPQ